MAEGILGLGLGQAAALNSDLINKLKDAESKATISPIETRLENIVKEKEVYASIESKVKELIESIKPFDLFISKDFNAFEQKIASTSGDSVTFDAPDMTKLKEGFTSVNVSKLAQKDVYQSNSITSTTKETAISAGNLDITVNGVTETFDTTGKTYDDLATEINAKTGMSATVEQVGTDSYRLVIKSENSGLDNKLTITGDASTVLGLDDPLNNILKAQDLEATVDGVEYKLSSNVINVDGLKITANKEGISTINISQDNSQIETQMNSFVSKFNELVSMIDSEVYSTDSKIADKSAIRDIASQIKDKLFGTYGTTDDKSIFNYGLEIDKSGKISLDSTKFKKIVEEDFAGLKDLFIGVAEKKGLGTTLKETLDSMNFSGGVLNTYFDSMLSREAKLNDDKERAEKLLNAKYEQLSLQFSAYGGLINQMEASFSGLKMLIQQSTASN